MPATAIRWRMSFIAAGLVLAGGGSGRTEHGPAFVDPMLERIMEASDQAVIDSGDPAAIPAETIAFFAAQAATGETEAGPAVRVRMALDADARAELESRGIGTYGRLDGFASAVVPMARLREVVGIAGIERMQVMRALTPALDVSRANVRSTQLEATLGSRGRGVILGLIDTGVDWRNPDFRNADGTTRIKYLWSQDDACIGTPPPAPFAFGCLYTEAQINAALQGGPAITAPDANGHGSHVLGIAAGNGRATGSGLPALRYVGMAPEADLIVVKAFPEPSDTNGCLTCYDIGAGLDFIDAKAAALGEPYVINLSLGSQFGGHDGSDLDEIAIDTLTGPGIPGKAVVLSAGNHRGHAIHIGGTLVTGQTNTHTLLVPAYTPLAGAFNDVVAWQLWYDQGNNLTVTLADPATSPCGSSVLTLSATTGQGVAALSTTSGSMLISDDASPAANGARFFDMEIDDQGGTAPCRGSWQLRVRGNSITGSGRYDAWIWISQFGSGAIEALWSNPDLSRVISIPGTARNGTTVGAYVTKTQWPSIDGNTYQFVFTPPALVGALAAFSSPGPTRDGRVKPDLLAPGTAIASTLSIDARPTVDVPLIVPDGAHLVLPGTSASAAHVSGIYAQLLALRPQLDAIQLREHATSTARVDAFVSQPVPNNDWGYGKIDALAAAQAGCALETCDGIDNDCDGVVDDGFGLGEDCSIGIGGCRSSGVTVCVADGSGTRCDALVVDPRPEICDGIDNDCDASTDEDLGTLTCGTGPCERTVSACVGGQSQTCVPGDPAPEICNGVDDDCNGAADDGLEPLAASVVMMPATLWPPNHRMVPVHAEVIVSGGCFLAGTGPGVALTAIASSESDDAPGAGDGKTADDVAGAEVGTADFDCDLRAERDAGGAGRTYALSYAVTDSMGHAVGATGHVFVPHDERGSDEPIVLSMTQGPAGTVGGWAVVPDALLYDVVRGDVGTLRDSGDAIDLGPLVCLGASLSAPTTAGHEDPEDPPPGRAFFYLVSYEDGWGRSGYGTESAGKPRRAAIEPCH